MASFGKGDCFFYFFFYLFYSAADSAFGYVGRYDDFSLGIFAVYSVRAGGGGYVGDFAEGYLAVGGVNHHVFYGFDAVPLAVGEFHGYVVCIVAVIYL